MNNNQNNLDRIEKTVLGSLILGADFAEVESEIQAKDFAATPHQAIYQLINQRHEAGEPYDMVALLSQPNVDQALIQDLVDGTASITNVSSYAKTVAQHSTERSTRRRLIETLDQLTHCNVLTKITSLQTDLDQIAHRRIIDSKDWQEVINLGIATLTDLKQRQDQVIYSGVPKLDNMLAGIAGSRMIVVAARPSVGKTALVQQIALRSAAKGKRVGIVSLEMNYDEIALRAFANELSLNSSLLAQGNTKEVEQCAMKIKQSPLANYCIFMDDATDSLAGVMARIAGWKRQQRLDFAIIDHIGLIELTAYQNRNEMLGKISRSIKKLCKRLAMPIIVVSQLNRHVEKENRHPRLSDLRDSGHIEQDADMVILLHRHEATATKNASCQQKIDIGIEKNRNGPTGWLSNPILFDGRSQSFQ